MYLESNLLIRILIGLVIGTVVGLLVGNSSFLPERKWGGKAQKCCRYSAHRM